jgi:hypothetical protein
MDEQNPKDFEQCSQNPDHYDDFQASQELLDSSKIQREKITQSHNKTNKKNDDKSKVAKN